MGVNALNCHKSNAQQKLNLNGAKKCKKKKAEKKKIITIFGVKWPCFGEIQPSLGLCFVFVCK